MRFGLILIQVVIKLMDAMIEEAPAKCREKIARSIDGPEWAVLFDSGG